MINREFPGMTNREYLIAISSGELGSFIEDYLRRFGITIDIDGPQTLQTWGKTFRIMRSLDVPKAFTEGRMQYDFGVTGSDVCANIALALQNKGFEIPFVTVKELTDSPEQLKGQLVLYERKNKEGMFIDALRLCTSPYYEEIGDKVLRELMSEYDRRGGLLIRGGKIEGYLSSGEAEFGIDVMYSGKTVGVENTANGNSIVVRKKLMDICPVVIGRPGYTYNDFLNCLYSDGIADGGGLEH